MPAEFTARFKMRINSNSGKCTGYLKVFPRDDIPFPCRSAPRRAATTPRDTCMFVQYPMRQPERDIERELLQSPRKVVCRERPIRTAAGGVRAARVSSDAGNRRLRREPEKRVRRGRYRRCDPARQSRRAHISRSRKRPVDRHRECGPVQCMARRQHDVTRQALLRRMRRVMRRPELELPVNRSAQWRLTCCDL
ncbi:hypothetical protein LMG29739_03190 [Paraburkholderia solisilvae]|uniref:Uncharacterized protein n=1 Tax=Paraburkholderia solisilvae TaxID=624376 RepID=A0A6J5DZF4_9BURK|nr:hypothetical protein LMG29739_03190 [Paraburkholderia solisilvae]